jgi:hypothetical protein
MDTKILEILVDATNSYNSHDFMKKAFGWKPFIERIKNVTKPKFDKEKARAVCYLLWEDGRYNMAIPKEDFEQYWERKGELLLSKLKALS